MNDYKQLFPAFLVLFIFLVPTVIAAPASETSITINTGGTGGNLGATTSLKADGASCSAASECTGGYCNSNVCASSAPSGGGGVPSSGATTTTTSATAPTPTVVSETKTIATISSGASGTVKVTKISDLKIEQLVINVKNTVTDVQVTVKESSSASLPIGTPAPVVADKGTVLKYLEVTKANVSDADINNVTIQFIVEKSWVENNSIDVNTIALQRLVGTAWNKLKTTLKEENSTVYKFEAESGGLSFFAIAGEKKVAPTACPTCSSPSDWSECINNKQTRTNYKCSADTGYVCQSYAEEQACEVTPTEKPVARIPISVWITFGVVAVAAIGYFLYQRKGFKF